MQFSAKPPGAVERGGAVHAGTEPRLRLDKRCHGLGTVFFDGGVRRAKSPDRGDALVWATTELSLGTISRSSDNSGRNDPSSNRKSRAVDLPGSYIARAPPSTCTSEPVM